MKVSHPRGFLHAFSLPGSGSLFVFYGNRFLFLSIYLQGATGDHDAQVCSTRTSISGVHDFCPCPKIHICDTLICCFLNFNNSFTV